MNKTTFRLVFCRNCLLVAVSRRPTGYPGTKDFMKVDTWETERGKYGCHGASGERRDKIEHDWDDVPMGII